MVGYKHRFLLQTDGKDWKFSSIASPVFLHILELEDLHHSNAGNLTFYLITITRRLADLIFNT